MSFKDFYKFYLDQHANFNCLACHVAGAEIAVLACIIVGVTGLYSLLWFLPLLIIYGFAWYGHYYYAKNHPATFAFDKTWLAPVYSMAAYWVMMYEVFTGRWSDDH